MHVRSTLAMLTGLTLALSACGLMPGRDDGHVVDRYPQRPPGWLDDTFAVQGGRLYAVGRAVRVYSPAAQCIHMARVNARLEMTRHAGAMARGEFSQAAEAARLDSDGAAAYLDHLAVMTGDNLVVQGSVPDEQYQERIMLGHMPHPDFYYNCEVRISLPMEDYVRARTAALSKFKDDAKGDTAQALAKAAEDRLNPSGS